MVNHERMGHGYALGWMWLVWPVIIAAIIVIVVLLARGSTRTGNRGGDSFPAVPVGGRTRAREILDERYARGELTDQEYLDRRRHLGESTDS